MVRGQRQFSQAPGYTPLNVVALFCVTFFKELFLQHLGAEITKYVKFVNELFLWSFIALGAGRKRFYSGSFKSFSSNKTLKFLRLF